MWDGVQDNVPPEPSQEGQARQHWSRSGQRVSILPEVFQVRLHTKTTHAAMWDSATPNLFLWWGLQLPDIGTIFIDLDLDLAILAIVILCYELGEVPSKKQLQPQRCPRRMQHQCSDLLLQHLWEDIGQRRQPCQTHHESAQRVGFLICWKKYKNPFQEHIIASSAHRGSSCSCLQFPPTSLLDPQLSRVRMDRQVKGGPHATHPCQACQTNVIWHLFMFFFAQPTLVNLWIHNIQPLIDARFWLRKVGLECNRCGNLLMSTNYLKIRIVKLHVEVWKGVKIFEHNIQPLMDAGF